MTTAPLAVLHPLSDVAGFQAISVEIERQRTRQLHSYQKELKGEQEEKECVTYNFNQTIISDTLGAKYSGKPKACRRVLHGESVRREVLSTYSIACPIHSFMVFGGEDDGLAAFLREAEVREPTECVLEAVQRGGNSSPYRLYDQFMERMESVHEVTKSGGTSSSSGSSSITTSASQKRLVALVEMLHQHLKKAWANGDKVGSLRTAIQASNLLSNVTLPTCYPSVYVLVTQVLDTFGDLVTRRLQATTEENSDIVATLLKNGINASDDLIPPEAVELCYNWFLKINSIRELLPRVCIELSLLRCFRYMKKTRVVSEAVVRRLAMQIRGVADPLVAAHLRWYLCAAAMKVFSKPGWATASSLDQAVLDSLGALEHISDDFLETIRKRHAIGRLDYLDLFIPSLQWQLDVLVRYGDATVLDQRAFLKNVVNIVVQRLGNPSCLLVCIWRAFPAEMLLSGYSVEDLLAMALAASPTALVSQLKLLEPLCLSLAHVKNLSLTRAGRIKFLNTAWDLVEAERSKIGHNVLGETLTVTGINCLTGELLGVCGALVQFSVLQLGFKQVNVLLRLGREIIDNTCNDFTTGPSDKTSEILFDMLSSLIISLSTKTLLESEHFMSLLQLPAAVFRRQLTVLLLQRIITNDLSPNALPCLISADKVLQLCKILHDDSVQIILLGESQEEMKLVERVFLRILDKTPSYEEALRLMCAARQLLPRFHSIFPVSITRALAMAYQCASNVSQEKDRDATKALLTFSLVTVPAVVDAIRKLRLNILISGVAFCCGIIVIGEAALEFVLSTLESIHMSSVSNGTDSKVTGSEDDLTAVVLSLLPIGIAAPIKNEHLYSVRRVLEWCRSYNWMPFSGACARVFLSVLLLTIRASEGKCVSPSLCLTENYSKDPAYVKACAECCNEAAHQLLNWLENCRHVCTISSDKASKVTAMVLEIYESIAVFALPSPLMNSSMDSLSNAAWQVGNEWGVLSSSLTVSHHILRSAKFVQEMGALAAANSLAPRNE